MRTQVNTTLSYCGNRLSHNFEDDLKQKAECQKDLSTVLVLYLLFKKNSLLLFSIPLQQQNCGESWLLRWPRCRLPLVPILNFLKLKTLLKILWGFLHKMLIVVTKQNYYIYVVPFCNNIILPIWFIYRKILGVSSHFQCATYNLQLLHYSCSVLLILLLFLPGILRNMPFNNNYGTVFQEKLWLLF